MIFHSYVSLPKGKHNQQVTMNSPSMMDRPWGFPTIQAPCPQRRAGAPPGRWIKQKVELRELTTI